MNLETCEPPAAWGLLNVVVVDDSEDSAEVVADVLRSRLIDLRTEPTAFIGLVGLERMSSIPLVSSRRT